MNIHAISGEPPPDLAAAVTEFEKQFQYPLGPGSFFRISHGRDYPRFFRAMGTNACFVAERNGKILGVISAARRTLSLPSGTRKEVAYVGDMKVPPGTLSGRVLLRLILGLRSWAVPFAEAAYSVVMEGTPMTPTRYTGRLGIEPFTRLGRVMILSIPTHGAELNHAGLWEGDEEAGRRCYASLSRNSAKCLDGDPNIRSMVKPRWLVAPSLKATGLLEDTRLAKRLIAEDGREMNRSHLSFCAWEGHGEGLTLIRQALFYSAAHGFDEMFLAVNPGEAKKIASGLDLPGITQAYANVYGYGLNAGLNWNLNTAEI